jgi:hypothetical protein
MQFLKPQMNFYKGAGVLLIGLMAACNTGGPKASVTQQDSSTIAVTATPAAAATSTVDERIAALRAYADSIPEFKDYKGKDISTMDPGILFAFSYHCYHTSRKPDAVFWFYWAQLRAKYMGACIVNQGLDNCSVDYMTKVATEMGGESLPEFVNVSRMSLYGVVAGNFKPEIDDYSFSRIEQHVQLCQSVIVQERQTPLNLPAMLPVSNLVPEEKRTANHQKVVEGFEKLVAWAANNKETIRERRKANGLSNN